MKKYSILLPACCLLFQCSLLSQITDPKATEVWEPEPRVVTPGVTTATSTSTRNGNSISTTTSILTTAPSDAIVLFDGKNLGEWSHEDGATVKWELAEDAMTVVKGTNAIQTKRSFGDCQLHVEWRSPAEVKGEGQGRGNSGVFLQSRYEVQVLDSYQNRTYSNGQAASIYKQHLPLVNACRPPGEWQTYDIIFTAPRFNADGMRVSPGYLTVIQNGVLVQNHVEIKGTTEYIGLPKNEAHGKAPIMLQDHGDKVSYRNIWIREL